MSDALSATEAHAPFMARALELAQQAATLGEVPVGAVVVFEGAIVGEGFNRRETHKDPLAHAEMRAIGDAAERLGRWRLSGCTLYVTLDLALCVRGPSSTAALIIWYSVRETQRQAQWFLFMVW